MGSEMCIRDRTNTKEELENARIASQDQIAGAKLGVEIAKEVMGDK